MIAGHRKDHDGADHRAGVVRKVSAYTTSDDDSTLELEGTFLLTMHAPVEEKELRLVNISGVQTLQGETIIGLSDIRATESFDIYWNGTEWRVH